MYKSYCIDRIKNKIQDKLTKHNYKNKSTYFTRNRKMDFEIVVLYGLNKRGLTAKMEIEDFAELINMW